MLWAKPWNQSILPTKTTRQKFNKNSSKLLWMVCLRAKCNSKKIPFFHMSYRPSAKPFKSSIRFPPKNKAKWYPSLNSKFNRSEPMMRESENSSYKTNQKLMAHSGTTKLSERFLTGGDKTDKLVLKYDSFVRWNSLN